MGNIIDGELDFASLKYLPKSHAEFPKLLLRSGDILFNRTNSAELVGKSAVYHGEADQCSFASYLIRVRLIDVVPELVVAFINSVFGRQWVKSVVSQQVGQANVNGSKLQALAVPLPPILEQQKLLERYEERQRQLGELAAWCETELARSTALRQSILKQAFSGRLVPQDPSDEPASALLARIRAAGPVKKKRKTDA
jgi:type I restriction enzyme S subunit